VAALKGSACATKILPEYLLIKNKAICPWDKKWPEDEVGSTVGTSYLLNASQTKEKSNTVLL
jgi:hypothetical protein